MHRVIPPFSIRLHGVWCFDKHESINVTLQYEFLDAGGMKSLGRSVIISHRQNMDVGLTCEPSVSRESW